MIPLEIEHLSKRYGSVNAVDDLSLSIAEGTVFGLLGRNGAGKSTTIGCALGLMKPTSGTIRLFGEELSPHVRERIAYVPEFVAIDPWMTPNEHAEFRRRCYGRFDGKLLRALLDRFEIDASRRLKNMSKGQRQAVALALAFAQRPELLILDEPASGLDPVLQRRLLDTMVSAAADGATILFSSHHIGQVEQAAERIAIVDKGKLVLEADVDELRAREEIIEAYFSEPLGDDVVARRVTAPYDIDGAFVRIYASGNAAAIEASLRALGPVSVVRRPMSLEQFFFASIGQSKEY